MYDHLLSRSSERLAMGFIVTEFSVDSVLFSANASGRASALRVVFRSVLFWGCGRSPDRATSTDRRSPHRADGDLRSINRRGQEPRAEQSGHQSFSKYWIEHFIRNFSGFGMTPTIRFATDLPISKCRHKVVGQLDGLIDIQGAVYDVSRVQ